LTHFEQQNYSKREYKILKSIFTKMVWKSNEFELVSGNMLEIEIAELKNRI